METTTTTTTTKPQDDKPFKHYKTDLSFEAWTEQQQITKPVFIKPHPYVLKRCATRTRPAVKLLHRLKHVYSVVFDNSKAETEVVVMEEKEDGLVGIKYVADDKPTSILSALVDLQLVNHDAPFKWTHILVDEIMSLIHRIVADDYDNHNVGRYQQLVVVDIVSSKKYCCFEEVADNEALLMSQGIN